MPRPEFRRIYIEREASDHQTTIDVLNKYPEAILIDIENYKQIFSRPRQDWALQKENTSLILAVKKANFLYPGTDATPCFGHASFYYSTLVLNCVYNCRYCYLQGMYPSAHIVAFVNFADFFREAEDALSRHGEMYLCLSYESDLTAFESVIPYCGQWIEFAAQHPDLTVEIRTKHSDTGFLDPLRSIPNVILAWTLSPDEMCSRFEEGAPPLASRLAAAKRAAEKGWKVRICIDPVLRVPRWKALYSKLAEEILEVLKPEEIHDFYAGTFRMNHGHFNRIKAMDPLSPLFQGDFERKGDFVIYPEEFRTEVQDLTRCLKTSACTCLQP